MPPDNTTGQAATAELEKLRRQVYDLQQEANQLELQLTAQPAGFKQTLAKLTAKQQEVAQAQDALAAVQKQLDAAKAPPTKSVDTAARVRSFNTTQLQVDVQPQMTHVPTAYYHLLSADEYPLVSCTVATNVANKTKRVRLSAYIEGYSAKAIETVEVKKGEPKERKLQPTLFADQIIKVNELTRASLNIEAEDLDTHVTEIHQTQAIWLLARNSAPLATYNPTDGSWRDMSQFLGAFVTPNQPEVMAYVRKVAERAPDKRLLGYQGNADDQARAIFETLKEDAKITYVDSLNDFNPNTRTRTQRVRLPRESLRDGQANCVDGVVLFASLLEAVTLNPALVILPQHVIVAWETGRGNGDWHYLDTTKIDQRTFDEAREYGQTLADAYAAQAKTQPAPEKWFRRWSLGELRGQQGIYPAE